LIQVPKQVEHIFLFLSINNGTFKQVESAYCRIIDQMGSELVRHEVTGNDIHSGLVVARLFRSHTLNSRWSCQAIGKFVDKKLAREETKSMCDEATKKRTRSSLPSPPLPSEVKKGPRLTSTTRIFVTACLGERTRDVSLRPQHSPVSGGPSKDWCHCHAQRMHRGESLWFRLQSQILPSFSVQTEPYPCKPA